MKRRNLQGKYRFMALDYTDRKKLPYRDGMLKTLGIIELILGLTYIYKYVTL